ncbi:hypothetical protein SAMN05216360_10940 [Methylobacterium phyllostachyos]|uniref:Uncharacterized protein n=1 Tax=Methylobacterium phyllostachyos TaxID=582672 RepID=A0A1H0C6K4_9HYPH|nr:hypothetical protein [Methylobacterium phyllostachyos]SDN53467.1 hypothetical protein SAMN05216360_10940 [Methylobacterium phyllostachyos]
MSTTRQKTEPSELLGQIARVLGVPAEVFFQHAAPASTDGDTSSNRTATLLALIRSHLDGLGQGERRRFGEAVAEMINPADVAR